MNGSKPSEKIVNAAPKDANAADFLKRSWKIKVKAPHGPRMATSKSSRRLTGFGWGVWKYVHFSCPMHSDNGTRSADLAIVENTVIKEFGWMGSLQSLMGLPSMVKRIARISAMHTVLSNKAATSHHQPMERERCAGNGLIGGDVEPC